MQPIRVLQVVTDMNRGGLETMLMNYYRHIDRTSVQFDFLVHRDSPAAYDDEIECLGGKIYRLPRLVPWSRSYKQALCQFFLTHPEYRIVHVHQDCLSAVALQAAEQCGVPVRIAHSHSSSQDKNIKYPIKLFYKQFIPRYATDLFACGKEAGDWMFGGAPYTVINNAIDAKAYSYSPEKRARMRKQLGLAGAFVIGQVGRFSPPKNHSFIVDVFAQVCKKDPSAKLLLVGDGELRQKITEKAHALDILDRIIFTGVRSDVADILQAMDVFLMPSLYEGLSLSIVEAQASGLPCFISDKVPMECDATGLVKQIGLSSPALQWAEYICAEKNFQRENTFLKVASAGFDIRENALMLQQFYLEKYI